MIIIIQQLYCDIFMFSIKSTMGSGVGECPKKEMGVPLTKSSQQTKSLTLETT